MSRRSAALAAAFLVLTACTSPEGGNHSSSEGGPAPATSIVLSIHSAGYRLAAPIQRTVAVRNGGSVVIAGGLDQSGSSVDGVFGLDPRSGSLVRLGSLPVAVHDATGQLIGTHLFVFGGGSTVSTNLVQSFSLEQRTGKIAGHLPVALSDLGSATIGATIYLVGGYDGRLPRKEIYATTNGTTFKKVGELPVGLRYPAVAAEGDRVIVAGGARSSGPSSAIYSFDPATGSTRHLGELPAAIGHAAGFTLRGHVYVAGGIVESGNAVSTVTQIDPTTGTATAEAPMAFAVSDTAVATGRNDAIFIGGERGTATLDQVLIASQRIVLAGQATPASPSPSATAGAQGAAVRPFAGLLLVADRGNNRLLVMNAKKHIVWRYPAPDLPKPPHPLYFPDDAFWVHGGHAIIVNEEENNTAIEIAYPSGRTIWTYGHPGVAGSSPGYLHQPDDLYPYPGGGVVVADAKNCRILFIGENGFPSRQIGRTGVCAHGLPNTVGYPNGDTPLPNGHLLLSELDGHWIDEVTGTGRVIWSHQVPGVVEPSDPQRLADGTFMVASYAHPGAVVVFDRSGTVLWSYHPTTGPGVLDHPSLAAPLPNGLVAVNDDFNHRIVLIDPKTKRIVWQYGTGVAGTGPGQLSFPDGLDLMLPGGMLPQHVDFSTASIHRGRP
jgi:hypothetical protein